MVAKRTSAPRRDRRPHAEITSTSTPLAHSDAYWRRLGKMRFRVVHQGTKDVAHGLDDVSMANDLISGMRPDKPLHQLRVNGGTDAIGPFGRGHYRIYRTR